MVIAIQARERVCVCARKCVERSLCHHIIITINTHTRKHTIIMIGPFFGALHWRIKWKSLFDTIDFPYKVFFSLFIIANESEVNCLEREPRDAATNLRTSFVLTHTHARADTLKCARMFSAINNKIRIESVGIPTTRARMRAHAHQFLVYEQQCHSNESV